MALCWIMLDPLDYARFIEWDYLLGPKPFTYGKKWPPFIILL